jgi:hypothetical protein
MRDAMPSGTNSAGSLWGCTLDVQFSLQGSPNRKVVSGGEESEEKERGRGAVSQAGNEQDASHRTSEESSRQSLRTAHGHGTSDGEAIVSICSSPTKRTRDLYLRVEGEEGATLASEERMTKSPKSKIWPITEHLIPPHAANSPLRRVGLHSFINEQIASPVAKFLSPSATSLCAEARFFGDF